MTSDSAAKKRLFDRFSDAVLRRKVAEIELRQANAEYQYAAEAYMKMLVEDALGHPVDVEVR